MRNRVLRLSVLNILFSAKCTAAGSTQSRETNSSPIVELFPQFVDKSPLENAIEEMDDRIQVLQVDVLTSQEYKDSLDAKYTSVQVDRTKAQFGKCHMRTGHSKRNCSNETCTSAESCCDLDKHHDEKKLYHEAAGAVKSKEKELEKLKGEKESRQKTILCMKRTFSNQIFSALVNSDIDTYTLTS